MYVLRRTDQRGGYVAANSGHTGEAYTRDLAKAETFTTREIAVKHSCPGNEVPILLSTLVQSPTR